MAVENVQTNSAVGLDGNSITTAVSNDRMTNDDFLKLMLTELQYQDPTKPMDSAQMLNDQMQMSTIETNMATIDAMQNLSNTFSNMALSNATGMMGKHIDAFAQKPIVDEMGNVAKDEEGNVITEKVKGSYIVDNIEISGDSVLLNSRELIGFKDNIVSMEDGPLSYTKEGEIIDGSGEYTGHFIRLNEDGRFDLDASGDLQITDSEGNSLNPLYETPDGEFISKYAHSGYEEIYDPNMTPIAYEDITKLFQ